MSNILKGLLNEANPYRISEPEREYGAPFQSRPRVRPQEPEDVPDDLPPQDPFKQDPAKLAKVEYSKDEGQAPNGKRYNMVMSVSGPSNAVRNEVEMFNKHHWGAKKIVDMKTIEAKTPNGPAQYTVYIVDNHKYGMWTPFKGEKPVGEPLVFKESQDGISASDLAEILYNRLEMRYPDIVTRYGHEVVGDTVMDVADFHAGAEELGTSDVGIMIRQILKKLENYNVDESKEVDYDDPKWDAMVKRVGQLAKEGPRKTVYDPVKRVYKTVPVNPPKDKGVAEDQLDEKWSQKYKKSINCSHPKGFSQRAHCAGKKKHNESIEMEMVCEDCGMCETHADHQNLDEACWKGYHKEGNKKMFGKTYPNCVKNEDVTEEKCPHCSGPMFSELMINEKKDACYYKVKSRYKVWPSAYASGALVKCRKKGAANWGNKSESKLNEFAPDDGGEEDNLRKYAKIWYNGNDSTRLKVEQILDGMGWEIGPLESEEGGCFVVQAGDEDGDTYIGFTPEELSEQLDENLRQWFKEKWVRFGPDGKIRGACARGDDSEGKPKCLPQSKAHSLGKKGRASAAARKRRKDPNPERSGKAINVNTKKKSNEGVAEEFELAGVGVAYELGRKAYKQGMTIRDNPYSATKEARKYDEWEKGLERGKWDAIEARKFRNNIKETKSNILKGLMR